MAGGVRGKEAVLPLKGFYDQLEHILSSWMNTGKNGAVSCRNR